MLTLCIICLQRAHVKLCWLWGSLSLSSILSHLIPSLHQWNSVHYIEWFLSQWKAPSAARDSLISPAKQISRKHLCFYSWLFFSNRTNCILQPCWLNGKHWNWIKSRCEDKLSSDHIIPTNAVPIPLSLLNCIHYFIFTVALTQAWYLYYWKDFIQSVHHDKWIIGGKYTFFFCSVKPSC